MRTMTNIYTEADKEACRAWEILSKRPGGLLHKEMVQRLEDNDVVSCICKFLADLVY